MLVRIGGAPAPTREQPATNATAFQRTIRANVTGLTSTSTWCVARLPYRYDRKDRHCRLRRDGRVPRHRGIRGDFGAGSWARCVIGRRPGVRLLA